MPHFDRTEAEFDHALPTADEGELATVFHEEGHNLRLLHGGDVNFNFRVTYPSVMNYRYAPLRDARTDERAWDFSGGELRNLNESNGFGEGDGLFTGTTGLQYLYLATWTCPPGAALEAYAQAPHRATIAPFAMVGSTDRIINFNCDTVADSGVTGLTFDLGGDEEEAGHVHQDFDDWGNLDFAFQADDEEFSIANSGSEPVAEPTTAELAAAGFLHPTIHPDLAFAPGCPGTPSLPRTGSTRRIPIVLWGGPTWVPDDLVDPHLQAATPVSSQLTDLDGDGHLDLWLEFRNVDVGFVAASNIVGFNATTADGAQVVFSRWITTTASAADSDGDGIHNACDACPSVGGTDRLPNGCPP